MRRFLSRSAESIRVLGLAAHADGNGGLLQELLTEVRRFRRTSDARRVAAELAPLLDGLDAGEVKPSRARGKSEPAKRWLSGIQAVARRFRARRSDDAHTVYLVLLRDPDREEEFGVYVGETSQTAEERFENHLRGHKASRFVKKYGVRLLRPFFNHLEGIAREEALDIEAELADALRDGGYWVEGGH